MKKSIIRTLKVNPVQWVALIILLFGCLQIIEKNRLE